MTIDQKYDFFMSLGLIKDVNLILISIFVKLILSDLVISRFI
jgi:hypothetical protein